LTVRALLAADQPWAPAGHEVAWSQTRLPSEPPAPAGAASDLPGTVFAGGRLTRLFGVEVEGPRLDLWRAPTDNDRYSGLEARWRALGLHRLTHRTDAVERDGDTLTVRTRVAPAAGDLGMRATYRWTATGGALLLRVDVEPEGDWSDPIPRLGLTMTLPGAAVDRITWFGRGPGEAYPDTGLAARVGRWSATVEELQTPYVRPQENGHRADVRWADLGPFRVSGEPVFGLTARRWSTAELAAARHRPDLTPGDRVHLHLDLAHQGIGTATCGPGPLPRYDLYARPATFTLRFTPA
ncbi:beta-galactosidase domain 4-containing protein, partial [Nonomuraea wenchangensis]